MNNLDPDVHLEIDIVTDQTSAHDPLNGYVPAGYDPDGAEEFRHTDPAGYVKAARDSMATHCEAMAELVADGSLVATAATGSAGLS